ncbi:hypothetical protein, partial [Rhizobium johnstonii]|uniref:hypothetical protein n=1 Tax=Rhizobium johnstonii TaxID=3019933 RepID=UPI003F9D34CA
TQFSSIPKAGHRAPIVENCVMAIVVETDLRRQGARRAEGSVMPHFRHAAGICTIVSSFTFLFALVIGWI